MDIVEEIRTDRDRGAKRLEGEYRVGLMTLARRLCHDEGDAEALVNHTFAEVLESIDNYVEQSAFFAWMCRILVRRHAKDTRRKINGSIVCDSDAIDLAVDEAAEERIFREVDAGIARDAIEQLPEDIRKTLLLHYFMDIPVREIARILSVPAGTVKWRLHYARMILAAKLGATAKKPGGRALLLALALCGLTALGAAVALVGDAAFSRVRRDAPAQEQQAESGKNASAPSDSSGSPDPSDPSGPSGITGRTGMTGLTEAPLSTFDFGLSTFDHSTQKNQTMNTKTLLAASAAFAAAGAPLTASANTLVIPQDTSIAVTSSAAYDAVEVHGSLSVTGTSASGTILSLNDGGTMAVGADSGDNATVSVGDYAQLKTIGGVTTIGGNGGTGLITLGGRRINNATEILTDTARNTASFYASNIWASADATGGTIDLVRLNEGGLLLHPQKGCKIINPNTSCDARILFNGGILAIDNAWSAPSQFQSVSGGLIASGNGGKAIILESENGHPIDLRYRWGSETTAPVLGTVKTAGDGSMRVWGETGSANHFGWLVSAGNFIWGHKGDLELANNFCLVCGAADVLPCLADGGDVTLTGDSPYNWLNLNRHSQSINGLVATGRSVLTNGNANVATLTFGAARPDGTLQAPVVGGKINVRKTGAGTLTITNTADFAKLTVESGTVRFCRNAAGSNSIGEIELAAGSALVVDGTIVRASVRNAGASVTCLNGGRLISTTSSDGFAIVPAEDAGGASCEWVKTGAGTLAVVATNLISIPSLHVAEGTLRLSAGGTAHPWLRFSFSAMNPSSANFCLSEIKVMDASGNRVDGGGSWKRLATTDPFYDANVPEGSDVANAPSDTTPGTMTPQSVWASDATFSRNNTPGYKERSPSCLFDGQAYTKLQYLSKATAANPKVFVLRLPSGAANAAGYLFRNGYSGTTHPSAWTLESSPDGENWTTVDSKSGDVPPSSNTTWYNGGEAWPINSGDVPGAAGFAPTAAVQVDEGAALDCSLVTGGQTLSNIVVDWALGGGTIRNAVFAANGTLSVVNAPDANLVGGTEIPLDFDGVSGTENLRDWTLVVNGVFSSKRIRFSNGRIAVGDPPTVMVFR